MIKNFKKELNAIKSSENINDKLMIFALYNEFYNCVSGSLDDRFLICYVPFMKKTFELVAASFNLKGNVKVNAKEFMKVYFSMLKCSELSSMSPVKSIISLFENELDSFIETSKYVNVIDKFESIPLDTKVKLMAEFREYINNMYVTTIELYGEASSKELRNSILTMLLGRLDEYLKDSLNKGVKPNKLTNNLKDAMMTSTKEYLINKLKDGEFGFENVEDEAVKKFFTSYNDIEQKIMLMCAIYAISGCDKSSAKERMEEKCELLNISTAKYIEALRSICIRYSTVIDNTVYEFDDETFDGDTLNRRKK